MPLTNDISEESEVNLLPARLAGIFDDVVCLVNNAGISPKDSEGPKIPIVSLSLAVWNRAL